MYLGINKPYAQRCILPLVHKVECRCCWPSGPCSPVRRCCCIHSPRIWNTEFVRPAEILIWRLHPLTLGQCSWGSLLRLAQCPPLVFQAPSSSLLTVNTGHFIAEHFSKIHSDEKWEKSSSQKWSYQSVLAAIYNFICNNHVYVT